MSLHTCPLDTATIHAADSVSALEAPFHPYNADDSVICLNNTNKFLLRRLAETYDVPSFPSSRMQTTAPWLAPPAIQPCSTPTGQCEQEHARLSFSMQAIMPISQRRGFLRVPAFRLPTSTTTEPRDRESCSVFIQTYHTASIPGVIISHKCHIAPACDKRIYLGHISRESTRLYSFSVAICCGVHCLQCLCPNLTHKVLRQFDFHRCPHHPHGHRALRTTSNSSCLLCEASVPRLSACTPGDFALVPNPMSPPFSQLPEFDTTSRTPDDAADLVVRALSRSALRLLWHQPPKSVPSA